MPEDSGTGAGIQTGTVMGLGITVNHKWRAILSVAAPLPSSADDDPRKLTEIFFTVVAWLVHSVSPMRHTFACPTSPETACDSAKWYKISGTKFGSGSVAQR